MTENWIKVNGEKIPNLADYCKNQIDSKPNLTIFVGADSIYSGYKVKYSNPIIFYQKGKGGHIIERKESKKAIKIDLFSRLWRETEMIAETAQFLVNEVGLDYEDIYIHLDYNSSKMHKSHSLCEPSKGLLKSLGFNNVFVKPESWASKSVGDNLCRK